MNKQNFNDFLILLSLDEKVLKRGNKYVVTTKDGSKVLGTHSTREAALKQLRAIEASKHS